MVMTYTPISGSTSITSAGYDAENEKMEIVFTTGRSYTFESVPEEVFEGLINADSPGRYYHNNIKGIYG